MTDKEKHKCDGQTYDGWHYHPCQLNGSIKRGEKHFCKRHDPVEIEKKRQAKEKQREAEDKANKDRQTRQSILDGLAKDISTKDLEKYKLVKE